MGLTWSTRLVFTQALLAPSSRASKLKINWRYPQPSKLVECFKPSSWLCKACTLDLLLNYIFLLLPTAVPHAACSEMLVSSGATHPKSPKPLGQASERFSLGWISLISFRCTLGSCQPFFSEIGRFFQPTVSAAAGSFPFHMRSQGRPELGFQTAEGNIKMAKIGFPSLWPRIQNPEERVAARGMPPWQQRSLSSPLTGAEEETRARSLFPNDYYFLYYGNNYSHPADKLLSQVVRLGRPWLLWDGKNAFPLHSPFSFSCITFGHGLPAMPTRLDQHVVNRPNCPSVRPPPHVWRLLRCIWLSE